MTNSLSDCSNYFFLNIRHQLENFRASHVLQKYENDLTISVGGGLEPTKKNKKYVVQIYRMKTVTGVTFRAKLNGTRTVIFNPFGFSERAHV